MVTCQEVLLHLSIVILSISKRIIIGFSTDKPVTANPIDLSPSHDRRRVVISRTEVKTYTPTICATKSTFYLTYKSIASDTIQPYITCSNVPYSPGEVHVNIDSQMIHLVNYDCQSIRSATDKLLAFDNNFGRILLQCVKRLVDDMECIYSHLWHIKRICLEEGVSPGAERDVVTVENRLREALFSLLFDPDQFCNSCLTCHLTTLTYLIKEYRDIYQTYDPCRNGSRPAARSPGLEWSLQAEKYVRRRLICINIACALPALYLSIIVTRGILNTYEKDTGSRPER